jgi:hypothetical protein
VAGDAVSGGGLRRLEAPASGDVPETPEAFLRDLGGPALLRVPGRDPSRSRAVATLLHGNEPSGLRALHHWLRRGETPAVDVLVLLGGVEAALAPPGFAHRMLPGRRDLNRCFRAPFEGGEGALAAELLGALESARPEALIDIHNTTGHTPPYGVGPSAGARQLGIVALFAERFLRSDLRLGALVEASDARCPSVTIECGRAGDPAADAVARAGLERFLRAGHLDAAAGAGVRVLADPVRVEVSAGARVTYGDGPEPPYDLTVARDVDRHNFETLDCGAPIGWLGRRDAWPVVARGADGREISRELFDAEDGVLRARCPLVPIMMTTDAGIAASDCLFYVVRGSVDS